MSASNYEIGQRLRFERKLRSLSQQEVGAALGVTFQQVQKYEKGVNRISVESMLHLSEKLGIHLMDAFSGNEGNEPAPHRKAVEKSELELLKSFRAIKNEELQRRVLYLVKAITTEG